ncbi:aldehyde dehydrogenase family protein [Aquabacterium sp. J223]|uniref:aldehyde dehydrogenase family protein n=1 Tax=Aquabacterium sp. J223 TaxID=2898431 RepID=UPI0021ADB0DA|nr:aldehyde dehydrogenase family protein [Aquabacterium sp. J223]UUX94045.1 aldehyde dehydrogenase family protein [Aquabacterium sp. J223]
MTTPLERALELARSPFGLLIGGQIVPSLDGLTLPVIDPSTGAEVTQVPGASARDIDAAVRSAKAALKGDWRRAAPRERERLLRRLAVLVDRHREELALLEALDTGKPLGLARMVDVTIAVESLDYYAGWPTKLTGRTLPVGVPDMLTYTRPEPAGVNAQIIPWNFPIFDAAMRIGMSLAAGCPLVLKVAETTPLSALYLARLVQEADLPPGVINIVPGHGHDAGRALVEHPDVAVIGFTGSTATGREIGALASRQLKRVSLELGGKTPNVLFDDADLEQALPNAVGAIFFNAGQVCGAGSRLLVHEKIHDAVLEKMSAIANGFKVGSAFAEGMDMGPLVSQAQYDKVRGYIRSGANQGRLAAGGLERPAAAGEGGFFVAPTVLADLPADSRVIGEEIFGPVLAVERFRDLDDALAKANAGPYGLAASVWTADGRTATRFADGIRSGTVWINCFHQYDIGVPWGGVKASGTGRERGAASFEHLLDTKVVWRHG